MINIIKNKRNRNLWALILAVFIIIALPAYALTTGGDLTTKASAGENGSAEMYDMDNVMSYYIDSINDTNTMVYAHYNSDSADMQDITCLSCHEMETLRELYDRVDGAMLEEERNNMNSSETTLMCLACHGSYEELAELTAGDTDFTDSNGTSVNPHIYGGGLADMSEYTVSYPLHQALACTECHSAHDDSGVVTLALQYCYSCHHAELFECFTCHL